MIMRDRKKRMSDQDKLPDICDLFNKYNCDKDRNGYLQVYHSLFHRIRTDIVTVLEIGDYPGSLFALRDYFVSGRIIGVHSTSVEVTDEPRIETYICNSTKKDDVVAFISELGISNFDIIIDNGVHSDMEQISTIRNLYPYLNDDGIYIIEGLEADSKINQCPSLIGCLCNHDSYFFAGVKNNMCVIQKHHLNSKRKLY